MGSSTVTLHALIDAALHPRHFYVGNGLSLVWMPPLEEEAPWEIFRGRLLDPRQSRETKRFHSWNIHQQEESGLSAEPLLSVKWDRDAGQVHVVRAILSYVWEGFDAGNNIVESRRNVKWMRELVGTLRVNGESFPLEAFLRAAVRGTSRLPLTSLEAPLPAFSLGQLDYLHGLSDPEQARSLSSWREVAARQALAEPSWRILETILRSICREEAGEAAATLLPRQSLAADFIALFQNVSLSPYTSFVENALAFLREAVRSSRLSLEGHIDVLARLLILLNRHLTAYDLITYHHRGANYPDALLLDAVLDELLNLVEQHPRCFDAPSWEHGGAPHRNRRAALRHACLLRRYYEGLPVPDEPTSPGENARVLPPPHVHVPEEQLIDVSKRTRRLYANDPLLPKIGPQAREILRRSAEDLGTERGWKEMGLALFIDRPLGWGKRALEPDLTPLLSHLAFSPAIARRRLSQLCELVSALDIPIESAGANLHREFAGQTVSGVPIGIVAEPPKPCVSLADAAKVSSDFVVIRTNMPSSLWNWLSASIGSGLLEGLREAAFVPIRRDQGSVLVMFDGDHQPRLEMEVDSSDGYRNLDALCEVPAPGLRILRKSPEPG